MGLDIRTLIFVLGLTHAIQFVVFIHQRVVNRTIRGVGWWLLWSGVEILAFTCMLLRAIPAIQSAAIVAQNGLLILGVMFLYIGIVRFLGEKENRRLLISLYAVFFAGLCYFLFVHDDINARGAIISATLAAIAFLSGRALLAYKTRPIAASANFLAVVFLAHACHFAVRAAVQLADSPPDIFFAPTLFNWTALMDAIVVGILWTFGTILMINQRLNAEMQAAKEEIELVFNVSPDAAVISRLRDGLIVNVNEGFVNLTGFSRAECIGKTTAAVNVWKDTADREAVVNELRKDGSCKNYQAVFRRKDASELSGLLSAVLFDLKDVPHVITSVRDITERKRAEAENQRLQAQLHQARKMESVGRLAGGVAHNFNNLLMGIMNYVELCRDRLPAEHPVRGYLDEITGDAQRSADLTRQLLGFASKQTIVPKVLDLNDTVARMLKLLSRLLDASINLVWIPAAGLWPVKLDPTQVDQILTNLCANARDAIAGAGKITVATGNATLDRAACAGHVDAVPGEYVLLTVRDDGCGMDEEALGKLFEPFYTTKECVTGAGLGLATVYGIVRQNNGFISVDSEPHKGTAFKVYLPRVDAAAPQPAAPAALADRTGEQQTVLLVDDEKSVRVTTRIFLENLGYGVLTAETPAEALRVAAAYAGTIQLLFTDVIMPGMNGRQLVEQLRTSRPHLKCLFMSAYTVDALILQGDLAEGVQFLSKPFGRDALVRKVREMLDSQRRADSATGREGSGSDLGGESNASALS